MESDAASSEDEALGEPAAAPPIDAGPTTEASSSRRKSSVDEIFAVNKPPSKRAPPPPPSKPKQRRKPTGAAPPPTPSAKKQALQDAVKTRDLSTPQDLLDDRVVCDPDENYSDNEKALTHFLRLHPMLVRMLPALLLPSPPTDVN